MRMRALALAAALSLALQAQAAEKIIDIPHGSTSVVLPCITLLDIDDDPAGAIAEAGITNATTGLEIKVRADVTDGWHAEHSQAGSTINAITGTIGQFETPDANDVHFEEVATGAGCYQLILPDSYYALDDGTTDCGGAACPAKELTVLIRDSNSPAFADKWARIGLNVESTAAAVDAFFDEPCTDHQTAGTLGNACFSTIPGINTTVNGHSSQLTNIQTQAARTALYAANVSGVTDQQNFVVDSGDDPGSTDAHAGKRLCIVDSDDDSVSDCQRITAYNTSTDTWTIAAAPAFTVEVGDSLFIPAAAVVQADIDHLIGTFLNCEVNTANFAGNTLNFACILTDLDGNAVTQASNDLEGLEIVVTSGAQIREKRFINNTVWDAGNSELQISISRALPGTLADAVTVEIR